MAKRKCGGRGKYKAGPMKGRCRCKFGTTKSRKKCRKRPLHATGCMAKCRKKHKGTPKFLVKTVCRDKCFRSRKRAAYQKSRQYS